MEILTITKTVESRKTRGLSPGSWLLASDFCPSEKGFTLIELVMVIVILGVLGTAVAVKWPSGMKEEAAVLDFIHAVRYAQHMALTRGYTLPGTAWGVAVAGNRYTVQTADGLNFGDPDFVNHLLPGSTGLSGGPVYFNGLGEPINTGTGIPLGGDTLFTVGSTTVTVSPETGYVE
ncbi:MAG: type II secretion system GspH family protein [Proteobacteria bacterium]|nr:type II secretion system GspH family protein [Pseudomonadota bacterium]